MANKDHLALLRKGVLAWNIWRKKNPEIRPDLREANLIRAYLIRANLRGADLRYAYLIEAKLGRADLDEANLCVADLRGANLEEVKNLTQQQLDEAKTNEKTTLPDYLRKKSSHLYP